MTPLTTLLVDVEAGEDRFVLSPERDADTYKVMPGFKFKPFALDRRQPVPSAIASSRPSSRWCRTSAASSPRSIWATRCGRRAFSGEFNRDVTYSFETIEPYYLQTRLELSVTQKITTAWDIVGRAGRYTLELRDHRRARRRPRARIPAIATAAASATRSGEYVRLGFDVNYMDRTSEADITAELRRHPRRLSTITYGLRAAMTLILSRRHRLSPARRSRVSAQTDYVIGAQDVLTITVYDQADLSGKFTVEPDGTLTFPLLGRVKAGGPDAARSRGRPQEAPVRRLPPQPAGVGRRWSTYRSQRIFVMGEVRAPGAYQLTGDMTIIEAIARAGSTTPQAADEAMIVRPKAGQDDGPVLPTDTDSTVIRVNLREIQEGALSKNVQLRDGDTLRRAEGARRSTSSDRSRRPAPIPSTRTRPCCRRCRWPAASPIAGPRGASRSCAPCDGKKKEIKVKLTDIVEPGDTIIVAERFF